MTDKTFWTEVTNATLIPKFSAACEIGSKLGVTYMEHPQRGDEAPIYAKSGGKIYNTNAYEID